MSSELRAELQRLLSALCDDDLDDAQRTRLQELLDGDVECRRTYLEYLDMHAHLISQPRAAQTSPQAWPHSSASPSPAVARPANEELPRHAAAPRPPRRMRQILGYVLVASATLAASLLLQVVWRTSGPGGIIATNPQAADTRSRPADYVATLTPAADCVWEDDQARPRGGSRLAPGELRLQKGVARVRFDNGPDLTIEGPAAVRIDSRTAATVLQGKVVFRTDETAAPFDLHTPTATLVDLGTEYAIAVGADGEEIHVFDGEVQRRPRQAAATVPEWLKAGEARRYGTAPDSKGEPAALDPASFVRQLAAVEQAATNPAAALIAYEGFDYRDAEGFRTGKANGGTGWKGNWMAGLTRPLLDGDRNHHVLNTKEGLTRAGAAAPGVGGCFDYTGFAKYHRRLATPVRMDAEGVFYLSFLFRREGPPADPLNALAVLLRTSEDFEKDKSDPRNRLNIGVGGPNQVFTHFGGAGTRVQVPLEYGETYLLVAKIAVGAAHTSQVFIRVYGPRETVEREEPNTWTVVGPSFPCDLVFDWLEVHVNSKTRQTLDELRLGSTWPSVTAPWLGAP
jgi:hypothetical protein